MSQPDSSPVLAPSQSVASPPPRSPVPPPEVHTGNQWSAAQRGSSSLLQPACAQKRTLSEVIGETFAPFDHRAAVVEPFEDEARRDVEFQEKLNAMLLELMLELHAWSTARPVRETEHTLETLEKDINAVMARESEQGRSPTTFIEKTRQRLGEFVTRIKMALAALTGLGI